MKGYKFKDPGTWKKDALRSMGDDLDKTLVLPKVKNLNVAKGKDPMRTGASRGAKGGAGLSG